MVMRRSLSRTCRRRHARPCSRAAPGRRRRRRRRRRAAGSSTMSADDGAGAPACAAWPCEAGDCAMRRGRRTPAAASGGDDSGAGQHTREYQWSERRRWWRARGRSGPAVAQLGQLDQGGLQQGELQGEEEGGQQGRDGEPDGGVQPALEHAAGGVEQQQGDERRGASASSRASTILAASTTPRLPISSSEGQRCSERRPPKPTPPMKGEACAAGAGRRRRSPSACELVVGDLQPVEGRCRAKAESAGCTAASMHGGELLGPVEQGVEDHRLVGRPSWWPAPARRRS